MSHELKHQSQSINHAYKNNKDQFTISQRHLYTLIDNGVLSVRNIDLPLKVRFKPRKQSIERKVDAQCRLEIEKDNVNTKLQKKIVHSVRLKIHVKPQSKKWLHATYGKYTKSKQKKFVIHLGQKRYIMSGRKLSRECLRTVRNSTI